MAPSPPSPEDFIAANFIAWGNNGQGAHTRDELQSYIDKAALSYPSIKDWKALATSSEISSQLKLNWDASGMYADAFLTDTGQIVIAFQGTATLDQILKDDVPIFFQKVPPALRDAEEFAYTIREAARGATIPASQIFVTGHSLGGVEAQDVQRWSRVSSTIFGGTISVSPDPFGGGVTYAAPGLPNYGPGVPGSGYVKPDLTLIDYVDRGDPAGNFASDAPTPEPGIAPGPNMNHVGTVQALPSDPVEGAFRAGDLSAAASIAFAGKQVALVPGVVGLVSVPIAGLAVAGLAALWNSHHPLQYYAHDLKIGGFDGEQVSFGVYYPTITPSDLHANGEATVSGDLGDKTFDSITGFGRKVPDPTPPVDGSVTFSGHSIAIAYPASKQGQPFATTASNGFNGYVFKMLDSSDPPITGVSLAADTNILGLTASRLTYTAHEIDVNVSGLTLPADKPGLIRLTATFGSPTTAANLNVINTTTGLPISAVTQLYTGPVSDVQQQYVNITADSVNITASTPNWFIHSGSGVDAIAVSSGTNVVDGGTGSNFLTSGSGTDTFFVDARGATTDLWSTVNNFNAGDTATIWGVTLSDFTLSWTDGEGAAGYTGLTVHATAAGKPIASLTLAGFTQADMAAGRLSVSSGTDPASGSAYMNVHANS